MATDFNINNFLGGGSAATFGNFGNTSTPADLFSLPSSTPSQPFAFDAFQDASFNSPQIDASLFGFQGTPSSTVSNPIPKFSGSFLGQSTSPFSPPSFADFERRLQSAQPASLPSQSFQENANQLLSNIRAANQDLVDFQARTFDPVVSSTPAPGLEPFNRFNTTTQQFEQLFGNPAARLPSADVFVKGETGFNDGARFLQSIRDEAQRNADNFTGILTPEKFEQAQELGQLMGTGDPIRVMNMGNPNPGANSVQYGSESNPVSAEDLNKLLNMRKNQQQALQRAADNQIVRGEDFQKAMTEMNKPFIESQAAFDRASALQQQALENRIPFGATFNYDDQGNKVLAGASARAAAATATGQQPMTFEEGKKFVAQKFKEPTNIYNQRVRSFVAQSNKLMEEEGKAVVEEVATFKNAMNSIGITMQELGFDDAAIAAGVKSAGSGINFARQMASILKDMPAQTAKEFTEVTDETLGDITIKTPKQYMIKETGEVTTLGYGPKGTLIRAFPPKLDEQGNIVQKRRIEEFANDQVQLYETGDFRADQETLNTLRAEITGADTQALDKLIDFRDLRAQSAQGLKKIITDIGRTYKTIMQQGLSEAEMIEAVTSAKFEGLLGSVRLEVLGPGVLTEQDAVRLIKAMGGFGFTANKEAAVRILDDIIEGKEKILRAKIDQYNDYRTSNLALRDLRDTEGNIRFEEITFTPRVSLPNL